MGAGFRKYKTYQKTKTYQKIVITIINNMKNEKTIRIETLQLIKDPQTFFETDKFLSVDVFDIAEMPISSLEKIKLRNNGKAFDYSGRTYMPILLKGSPENLFLNTKNGLPCQIGNIDVLFFFDGKLSEIIAQKKIYDISNCYKKKGFNFRADTDFMINRYVLPYVMGVISSHKAKVLFPGNILMEVRDLKPSHSIPIVNTF